MARFKTVVMKMVKDRETMTMREAAVMMAVREAPAESPATVRGLAAALNIPKPSVTRALDALVGYSWVQRKDDPKDKRSVLAIPTSGGRKVADWMLAA